jgi:hypothetical protein
LYDCDKFDVVRSFSVCGFAKLGAFAKELDPLRTPLTAAAASLGVALQDIEKANFFARACARAAAPVGRRIDL